MAFRERFVTEYLDPLQSEAEISRIATTYPELCRLETLPHLSHGYQGAKVEARGRHPVRVLHVTVPPTSDAVKPAVLLMRSHHAREWINSMAIVETARQLVENYRRDDPDARVQSVVRTLDKVEFLIIAESNPDGARLSFFDPGQRMWRKNLRAPETADGCPGVDCNRNFPRYWGEEGSSSVPCAETYRGPQALSEPEAANIAELVGRQRNIIFAIDSHSYGRAIFRPSRAGGQFISQEPVPPEDDAVFQHLEQKMNENIKKVRGLEYATGSTSNHAGTTDEFLFFNHHIFGFDLECGDTFQPPPAEAVLTSLEVVRSALALGLCATGETGLPVNELIERRHAMPFDGELAPEMLQPLATTQAWKVDALDREDWRRFLLICEPLPDSSLDQQIAELAGKGFDISLRAGGGRFEVVASSSDLTTLLALGYRPHVTRDLLTEMTPS